MGWKCNKCGNTELFTEVNPIETTVIQEKDTTKITKVHDKYREGGALNAWCNKCDSEDVKWVNVPDQSNDFVKDGGL